MITVDKINSLFEVAIEHRNSHDCSAYPYEDGDRLVEWIQKVGAKNILEIGTGCGYSATIMAMVSPEIAIETLEKDLEHSGIAQKFVEENNVQGQVKIIDRQAEEYFDEITKQYDLIFFDGYQIHLQFLPHYERLLKPGGILFLGNNHLSSRTSAHFFEGLNDKSKWEILETFSETTVAKKL